MKIRILAVLVAVFAASLLLAQTAQLKVPDAEQFVGAPKGERLTGETLHKRTYEVGSLLRCPVCQGLSVADSPSEMAVNMKEQVKELLSRGYTEEQILKYFELSYGQFVLLKPKQPLVWLLPPIALVIGGIIVFMKMRNLKRVEPAASAAPAEAEEEVDPYVARVRELVSGGK